MDKQQREAVIEQVGQVAGDEIEAHEPILDLRGYAEAQADDQCESEGAGRLRHEQVDRAVDHEERRDAEMERRRPPFQPGYGKERNRP